jgi:hypothetical protein
MKNHLFKLTSILGIALAVALVVPQRALADDDDDPPSRVARLSYARGTVSFNPAGTDDWVSAVVNRPMTTGDKLWTDNGARAELNIGSAVIRLSSNTGFSFLNLDDRMAQVRLTEGTLNLRVRHLESDETIEIDTPNLAFSILRPGNYKIDVNEAGDSTMVTVRDGEGEVTGGGSAYTIHPRETGTFSGIDQLDADIQRFGDDDDFDRWCSDRDRRADRSQSSRYVSSDVIGYEDLDEYGGWRPVPEYGTVWFPHTTIVGWAPYRYGHWVWISPWGWTWVDDAPWGFAPFHYGRWVTVGGVWGWVPCAPRAVVGVAYVRPVYAPALVAWVGGPHFSVGIGIGGGGGVGVAWFPLAPREVYVPSYRVSRTYVTNVNVSNTTVNNVVVNNYYNNVVVNKNVTNIRYVNQSAPNGVTATSQQNFASAQSVGHNMLRVDRREVETAQVNATTPTVTPQQRSFLGAGEARRATPPARFQERPVVAKTAPPPAPVSFIKQQQEIQANGGRPPAVSQLRRVPGEMVQQERSNIKMAPPARTEGPQDARGNGQGQRPNYNGNRPGQPLPNGQNKPNQNPAGNNAGRQMPDVQSNSNRPPASNNAGAPQQIGQPGNPPANDGRRERSYNDRPSNARPNNANPASPVDPRVEQKQQQQLEQLRQKQDQERQRIEQKQIQEQQKIQQKNPDDSRRPQIDQRQQQQPQQIDQRQVQQQQKAQQTNADDARRQQAAQRQQQVEQRQQQQLQQLEQKHTQEQQKLEQKQQQERQKQQEKPANKPQKEKDDKPHNRG